MQFFSRPEVKKFLRSLRPEKHRLRVRVLDAAYWMKGCSSLGRLRYAVLLRIAKGGYRDGGLCLIDIKEAVKPAAPRSGRSAMSRNNAENVVEGARQLSPFLGNRMLAADLLNRDVFIRELLPQDLKSSLTGYLAKKPFPQPVIWQE